MERIVQTLKKTGIWDRCYHIQVKINHTPSPPKLHYHVIIHFEIHVYLHFPVSLYIQSLNFIDCYGTMVVLFIRDVVCVWGGDGGVAHCFKTVILMSFSCWVLILFDLYFRAGRRRMLSCVLYMGTYMYRARSVSIMSQQSNNACEQAVDFLDIEHLISSIWATVFLKAIN